MTARPAAILVTAGVLVTMVGSFAPWLSSLGVSANSWDLRDLVLGLGFSNNGAFDVAVTLWAVVPVVLVVAVAAAWWEHALTSAVFGAIGSIYAGIVAFAVLQAPDIAVYTVEWGVPTTVVGSLAILGASVWQIGLRIVKRGASSESALPDVQNHDRFPQTRFDDHDRRTDRRPPSCSPAGSNPCYGVV